jgi:hypothetical protein
MRIRNPRGGEGEKRGGDRDEERERRGKRGCKRRGIGGTDRKETAESGKIWGKEEAEA